jgi:phospholipid transport system substrate-binding protein
MTSELTRRFVLMAALSVPGLAALPAPARALTEARARTLVDSVVHDINAVIRSGKPLSGMIAEFERIFARYADVSIIARSTLGPAARSASPAQLRAYTEAFRSYIARKYGKRFNEFAGGRIEVNFLVSDRSGQDRFFDIVIEGVSLRISERSEIGAMLDRRNGDIDKLISDLASAG